MTDIQDDRPNQSVGPEAKVRAVRDRYATFATAGNTCCGGAPDVSTRLGYLVTDLDLLPEGANLGLGCGAPVQHLELEPGETVLDLGSGAGIDALIAARAVGPSGKVIGIDMTPEMVHSAADNARAAGVDHVEFREGRLERLPVADASVDAVTSNCVINLVPNKRAVFAEISRVLRPGGRLVVSDIVLDGELPDSVRDSVMAYVGCVAGAETRSRYFEMLAEAGLTHIEILKDVDFLEITEKASPGQVLSIMDRAGVPHDRVAGIVRSITFRANKLG